MYENRTQTYDQEIHEEYLIRDTPFLLPHSIIFPTLQLWTAQATVKSLYCIELWYVLEISEAFADWQKYDRVSKLAVKRPLLIEHNAMAILNGTS